jgi:hypothetical protein
MFRHWAPDHDTELLTSLDEDRGSIICQIWTGKPATVSQCDSKCNRYLFAFLSERWRVVSYTEHWPQIEIGHFTLNVTTRPRAPFSTWIRFRLCEQVKNERLLRESETDPRDIQAVLRKSKLKRSPLPRKSSNHRTVPRLRYLLWSSDFAEKTWAPDLLWTDLDGFVSSRRDYPSRRRENTLPAVVTPESSSYVPHSDWALFRFVCLFWTTTTSNHVTRENPLCPERDLRWSAMLDERTTAKLGTKTSSNALVVG